MPKALETRVRKLGGFAGKRLAWLTLSEWASAVALCASMVGLSHAAPTGELRTQASVQARDSSAKRAKAMASPRAAATKGRVSTPGPATPSEGHLAGLQAADDDLALKSSVALVIDSETDEVLFSKNAGAVLPIASITKLMTALVVIESGASLAETLTIAAEDVRATAASNGRGRLAPGTQLTRGELLHLALMASDNRAAQALGRSHPRGLAAFVEAMNIKASELGMRDTRFVEPTGLSSANRSSATDLAALVRAAAAQPAIREYSTASETQVQSGRRQVAFRNTNGLVRSPHWEIEVQKTGYIAAAGRCVVLQAHMAGRRLIMVLLDSTGRYSRFGDAERLRRWLLAGGAPQPR